MKLIRPKVEILDRFKRQQIIGRIATIARTCYKSEDLRTADRDVALVKRLIESKHEAMLEFVDITVKFTCSRAISHELVRHRLCSFAQESQRYCNYSKDKFGHELTFITPGWLNEQDSIRYNLFIKSLEEAERNYLVLTTEGCSAQEARDVLPNATKTEVNMKANLREWRHFLDLRCSTAAHPDMRVLALDLLKQLHEQIPIIFDDLYTKYYDSKI